MPWNANSFFTCPSSRCPLPSPSSPSPKSQISKSHFAWLVCAHSQPATSPRLHNPTLKCPQLPSNKGKTSPHPPWYEESSPFPLFLNHSPKLGTAANAFSEQLHPHRHVLSPPSTAPLLFRRPPPLWVSISYRVSAALAVSLARTAHTHRNKPTLAASWRRAIGPHPSPSPSSLEEPNFATSAAAYLRGESPPRQSQEDESSPEEPGSGEAGGGRWARLSLFFPPPLLGRVGAGWSGGSGRGGEWWAGARPGLGSGDRGVTIRRPPGSVGARTPFSPGAARPSSAPPQLLGAGGIQRAGRLEKQQETAAAGTGQRARIRRQLLLFGFPRLRVGREKDKHDDTASVSPK
ncbi:unnamed protein product [Rangifer tarandus platyrhynchus]|uniref:Uncharacterized protein n=1 Tax=Rangifer tarandus platyrhynchus TaxID=3082113 RepID=A0ABN8XU31_RANTA|nr:unnamed protein product [Rangifer tarandus platyrhynchus]